MIIENITKLICLRCGHNWHPKKNDVRSCPNCHSALWDKPKEIKGKFEDEALEVDIK